MLSSEKHTHAILFHTRQETAMINSLGVSYEVGRKYWDDTMLCTPHLFWYNHNLNRIPMLARFLIRHLLGEEMMEIKEGKDWEMYNSIIHN